MLISTTERAEQVSEIKNSIMNGGFSLTQLNGLVSFIHQVQVLAAKSSIAVGDEVYLVQKTKRTLGTVIKVNTKKAIVKLPQGK